MSLLQPATLAVLRAHRVSLPLFSNTREGTPMTKEERGQRIELMIRDFQGRLAGNPLDMIDYAGMAETISREVGAPVIVFAAPLRYGEFRLVAYEVPSGC